MIASFYLVTLYRQQKGAIMQNLCNLYNWINLRCITLFLVNWTIEYNLNFALWPGLSALPSPPIISWVLLSFNSVSNLCWCFPQMLCSKYTEKSWCGYSGTFEYWKIIWVPLQIVHQYKEWQQKSRCFLQVFYQFVADFSTQIHDCIRDRSVQCRVVTHRPF